MCLRFKFKPFLNVWLKPFAFQTVLNLGILSFFRCEFVKFLLITMGR